MSPLDLQKRVDWLFGVFLASNKTTYYKGTPGDSIRCRKIEAPILELLSDTFKRKFFALDDKNKEMHRVPFDCYDENWEMLIDIKQPGELPEDRCGVFNPTGADSTSGGIRVLKTLLHRHSLMTSEPWPMRYPCQVYQVQEFRDGQVLILPMARLWRLILEPHFDGDDSSIVVLDHEFYIPSVHWDAMK